MPDRVYSHDPLYDPLTQDEAQMCCALHTAWLVQIGCTAAQHEYSGWRAAFALFKRAGVLPSADVLRQAMAALTPPPEKHHAPACITPEPVDRDGA